MVAHDEMLRHIHVEYQRLILGKRMFRVAVPKELASTGRQTKIDIGHGLLIVDY